MRKLHPEYRVTCRDMFTGERWEITVRRPNAQRARRHARLLLAVVKLDYVVLAAFQTNRHGVAI